ncbi:cytochrome b family protein [Lignipirellula cremea]|uniref:Cytochrome b/b6 C-terminal region profile domain-containing protein n=1 Tax=Lignipirellula cremea TaxID=2528010 RepID=A0A518DYX4_9BACT|nr:hypothetical protein [Lignipirellula cremea]QDU97005.1 hypothetical protein Pla8534_48300 [Lignipirellula cremea]
MHHVNTEQFLAGIAGFLGAYYVFIALMNASAALYLWSTKRDRALIRLPGGLSFTVAALWLAVSLFCCLVAAIAMSGHPSTMGWVSIPQFLRDAADAAMGPVVYSVGSVVVFAILFIGRKFFVKPVVAWAMLNLSLLWMGFSMTDPDFAAIVTKPDNVPIVGMVLLLGFFTWLSAYKAVENDERMKNGEEPTEMLEQEKVLVWPDLVYTELICMVVLTSVLLLWAILLQAPLEEPASSVKTPNPSKAPWYFLGLQEMLVYYDPWMAGVVLPSMVVAGLMAIPYIDFNKRGNGYYTIDQRMFAYLVFQFGFLVMWVTLIVMGTFLRGPNWNFFGFYETWDAHKVEALNNVNLSEYFWNDLLSGAPKVPEGAGLGTQIGYILLREFPGILLLVGYLAVVPPLLAMFVPFFQRMFVRMGFLRFMVLTNLLLMMALLPIKMAFRWSANLKYFIAIPEFFLNF